MYIIIYTHSWPFNNRGLNCVGPFIHSFFSTLCMYRRMHGWLNLWTRNLKGEGLTVKIIGRFLTAQRISTPTPNPHYSRVTCVCVCVCVCAYIPKHLHLVFISIYIYWKIWVKTDTYNSNSSPQGFSLGIFLALFSSSEQPTFLHP